MQYRSLGSTGLSISVLALGAMNFGGRTDDDASEGMLRTALEAGINLVDTADVYSSGRSEAVVGDVLSRLGCRDEVLIATKCGLPVGADPNASGGSRRHILESCERSLVRLRTDRIDLFQLHRPAWRTDPEQTLSALDQLVRDGKVINIGSSTHPAWFVMECLAICSRYGWAKFVAEQSPYNLLDRTAENELIPMAERHAVAILAWSPLAGGILAGRYAQPGVAPVGSRAELLPALRDRVTPRALEVANAVAVLGHDLGLSASQLALLWVRDRPGVACPIIGPRTPAQLAECLSIADFPPLAEEVLATLDTLVPPGTAVADFHNSSGWTAGSRSPGQP